MPKRKYKAITQRGLLRIEGMQALLDAVVERMDRATAQSIKDIYVAAATKLTQRVRQNIAALPYSERLKEALRSGVVINRGQDKKPNVLVGVSQKAGVKQLGRQRFMPNPYWFEHGTAMRVTSRGARGRINATPFFRPAVLAARDDIRTTIADGMRSLLIDAKP